MISPLLILSAAALFGAFIVARTFAQIQRPVLFGAALGAVTAAAGSQLFMIPLNYCTFEPERDPLDVLFGVVLIGAGMALFLVPLNWLARRYLARHTVIQQTVPSAQGLFRGWLTPILMLAPTLIVLLGFLYYPSLDTLRISTLLALRGAPRTRFVCVDNFTSLLTNNEYLRSVWITFVIAFAIMIIGLSLSVLIANAAYQPVRGASVYRTLLIWPYAISPVVAGVIFFMIFNQIAGVANYALDRTLGVRVNWLSDPSIAPITVIIASVWKSMGFNILFYIAGLQNIGSDLREAASIDGANVVQRFFYITLPLLSPITFFLVVTNLTYAFFDIYGAIDALTGGGPLKATNVLIYNVYQTGFTTNGDLGKAAAQSIVLFLMVVGITYLQFRTSGRRVNYGA
jgi:sn-glycerol 3-phosphate transport system permease protein